MHNVIKVCQLYSSYFLHIFILCQPISEQDIKDVIYIIKIFCLSLCISIISLVSRLHMHIYIYNYIYIYIYIRIHIRIYDKLTMTFR